LLRLGFRARRLSAAHCAQAATASAQRALAQAQKALKSARAAAERAEAAAAAPKKAQPQAQPAAPALLQPPLASALHPPPPTSLLWDGTDALFGPIDEDFLLGPGGHDDLALPPPGPGPQAGLRPGAPPGRRLLQAHEAQPWMAGALVEVYWEAPDEAQPPTGWYTARVQKMSQRGATQLHYEQSQAVEVLESRDLQSLIKRGLIAILQPPPGGIPPPDAQAAAADPSHKRKR
jgi:hypothetical protein